MQQQPGYTGTALALLAAGVPQVVAMRYEVGDDYARELAPCFLPPPAGRPGRPLARNGLGAGARRAVSAAGPVGVLAGGPLHAAVLRQHRSAAGRSPRGEPADGTAFSAALAAAVGGQPRAGPRPAAGFCGPRRRAVATGRALVAAPVRRLARRRGGRGRRAGPGRAGQDGAGRRRHPPVARAVQVRAVLPSQTHAAAGGRVLAASRFPAGQRQPGVPRALRAERTGPRVPAGRDADSRAAGRAAV